VLDYVRARFENSRYYHFGSRRERRWMNLTHERAVHTGEYPMTTRTIAAALGLAALALTSGTALAQTAAPAAPAPAAPAEAPATRVPPHHVSTGHHIPAHKPLPVRARSQDAAVDDLNAQSLSAAQAGKDFTPSAPAPAPAAKKM
jgi:hypothetical protein